MRKIRPVILMLLCLCVLGGYAQNLSVSGVVTAREDGHGLPGVTVRLQGTGSGTLADIDGKYRINNVPKNGVLEFIYIGRESVIVEVKSRAVIDVVMEANYVSPDVIVKTALGIKKEAKSLGYAVTEVKGDDLTETQSVNVTNAFAGLVPGLQLIKGGGVMASSKILLRGYTSFTGSNQPLIMVDGVPIDNFVGGNDNMWGGGGEDYGNGLSDISAEDIEVVTVLRGAAAAALYGSRGGNGAILISTKRGEVKQGLGITVKLGLAIEDMIVMPTMQDNFSQGENGLYNGQSRNSWGVLMDGKEKGINWQGNEVILYPYDNLGAFYSKSGIVDKEAIEFQQKFGKTAIYASVNRVNDASVIPDAKLNRTSVTARVSTELGKKNRWTFDVKANYINANSSNRPTQGVNPENPFYTVATMPRSVDLNNFKKAVDYKGEQLWWDKQKNAQENPFWTMRFNQTQDKRDRVIALAELGYKFLPWLKGEVRAGIDYYDAKKERKKYSTGGSNKDGEYGLQNERFNEQNYRFLINAQKDNVIGKFGGMVIVGGDIMFQNRDRRNQNAPKLLNLNQFDVNSGVRETVETRFKTQRETKSLYGMVQLNWNKAVYIDATLRNDWCKIMSVNNKSYLYPSVNVSVGLSEIIENFPKWFSFAKLRASYAEVGNDLNRNQLYNMFSMGNQRWVSENAPSQNIMYNDNLTTEKVKTFEVGADLRFFNNRLRVDLSWYNDFVTNLIIENPINGVAKMQTGIINGGKIQNNGWEIAIGVDLFSGTFNWITNVNLARNVTKIIELTNELNHVQLGKIEGMSVVAMVGGMYGDIYGTAIKKVDDVNNQFYGKWMLNQNGEPIVENEKIYLGNQAPIALLAWNNILEINGFSLMMNFDAKIGGKVFSSTMATMKKFGTSNITAPNGKREPFLVEGVVNAPAGYGQNNTKISPERLYREILGAGSYGIIEPNLYDATSVRLRTLSIGYEFPKKLLGKVLQRLAVSATANNCWLIYSSIPGVDPEIVSAMATNVTALELGAPPAVRSFSFNVTVGF